MPVHRSALLLIPSVGIAFVCAAPAVVMDFTRTAGCKLFGQSLRLPRGLEIVQCMQLCGDRLEFSAAPAVARGRSFG
jgi:hypothetical protein